MNNETQIRDLLTEKWGLGGPISVGYAPGNVNFVNGIEPRLFVGKPAAGACVG